MLLALRPDEGRADLVLVLQHASQGTLDDLIRSWRGDYNEARSLLPIASPAIDAFFAIDTLFLARRLSVAPLRILITCPIRLLHPSHLRDRGV